MNPQPNQRMPKNPTRLGKLADQIQRDLAGLIRTELKDPRVGMVTLTGVEMSPDGRHANVYFTTLGGTEAAEGIATGLRHAAGFLRTQLAKGFNMRVMPELHFYYDESVERGMRLSRLIDDAVASRPDDPDGTGS